MKILAVIQPNYGGEYIVQMTGREITHLTGEDYLPSLRIEVGQKYEVADAWNALRAFRQARAEIEKAATVLRACAALSETAAASYVVASSEPQDGPTAAQ